MADANPSGDAAMPPAEDGGLNADEAFGTEEDITADLAGASADEIKSRIRLLDNDIRVMKSEMGVGCLR